MFEDKTGLGNYFIGLATGGFIILVANAAVALDASLGTRVTLLEINLYVSIVASIFLIIGLALSYTSMKQDAEKRKEFGCLIVMFALFAIAYGILGVV
jgi:hypothetical protein